MAKHVKAFTYKPKIQSVKDGRCTQTIRPLGKRPVQKGDSVLFHGWEGRPYRSKWSWRLRVNVIDVKTIVIGKIGFSFLNNRKVLFLSIKEWDSSYGDNLARKDGIDPPTGKALGELFNSMYDLKEPKEFQVITWKVA